MLSPSHSTLSLCLPPLSHHDFDSPSFTFPYPFSLLFANESAFKTYSHAQSHRILTGFVHPMICRFFRLLPLSLFCVPPACCKHAFQLEGELCSYPVYINAHADSMFSYMHGVQRGERIYRHARRGKRGCTKCKSGIAVRNADARRMTDAFVALVHSILPSLLPLVSLVLCAQSLCDPN